MHMTQLNTIISAMRFPEQFMTVFPIAMNFIDKKRKRKWVKQEMFEKQIFTPDAKLKRVIDVKCI
mgnify:CR=1 FL=1